MARDFIELFERFSRAQSAKDREVVAVRILEKRGVGRALVELPTCEQGVIALEPTPIACGAQAQAVINRATGATTILPGPRSSPGRATVFAARVRGDEPAPEVPVIAAYLLLVLDGTTLQYVAYTAAAEKIGLVGDAYAAGAWPNAGATIDPEVDDELGPGTRIFWDPVSGDLVTVDYLGLSPPTSTGATYTYTPESPWLTSPPQKVGSSIYWWEWQASEASETTPVRLMRSASAKWTSPVVIATGTVTGTVLSTGDWTDAAGADFTATVAGLWLRLSGEIAVWERVTASLGGGGFAQRVAAEEEGGGYQDPIATRAGLLGLTRTAESPPDVPASTPPLSWDGGKESDYAAWGSVPDVRDIAPDPGGSGVWIWAGNTLGIQHRSTAGALLDQILPEGGEFFPPGDAVVGVHVLAETFEMELPPEGE